MINKIEQLIIIVTGNCNSRCIHCSYWKNNENINLDKFIIFKTILSLKRRGLKSVMISGGEPFLHPNIKEIIKFIHNKKLKIKFATNGIILDKMELELLKLIDDFSISLDSANKETYLKIRGVDKFNDVLRNIELLKKIKKRIKLSFLIQKKNYNEMPSFLDLCQKLKIKDISLLLPNKFGDFNKHSYRNYGKLKLSKKDLDIFEKKILPVVIKKIKKYGIKSNYQIKNIVKIIEYFRCLNNGFKCSSIRGLKCSFPINNLVLTEKGKLKPCLFMPYEFENTLLKDDSIDSIEQFRSKYIFEKEIFNKYCLFCLEVPL